MEGVISNQRDVFMQLIRKMICISLLAIIPQAVHGSAPTTSFLTAQSSPQVTKMFKFVFWSYILGRAGYRIYRNYNKHWYNVKPEFNWTDIPVLALGFMGVKAIFSAETSNLTKSLGMGAVIAGNYIGLQVQMNRGFLEATKNNDIAAVAEYLKGLEGSYPNKKTLGAALAATDCSVVAQTLVKAGAAATPVGHRALVQKFPSIAQQEFGPKQKALTIILSKPRTINSKVRQLPKEIAAHIASFNTGIDKKTLAAEDVLADSLTVRP